MLQQEQEQKHRSFNTLEKIKIPKVKLSNGSEMPIVALGTSESALKDKGQLINVIKYAVSIGYRHIDSSWISFHDSLIGRALHEILTESAGQLKREDFFVTSKLWNTHHAENLVQSGLNDILRALEVDFVDLLYMNWPVATLENGGSNPYPRDSNGNLVLSQASYLTTYKAMEECVRRGEVKSLGLKNFNMQQIQNILENCSIKPAVVQIECHPYFQNSKLIEFCQSQHIQVTVFSPHGSADLAELVQDMPKLIEDQVLVEIGKKYGKSAAQVCVRWCIQRGCAPIAKAVECQHVYENANVFDFELNETEMNQIKSLEKNLRIFKAAE